MQFLFDDYVLDVERRELNARVRVDCARTAGVRSAGLHRAQPRPGREQGRPLGGSLGRADRIRIDFDQPHQCRAQGGRRQRRATGPDPHGRPKGHSLCRRRDRMPRRSLQPDADAAAALAEPPTAGNPFLHGLRRRADRLRRGWRGLRRWSRPPTGSITSNTTGRARSGSHWIHAMGAHTLIRYDERGNGLSDWDVDDISFEAFVRDLESVVDATVSRASRCSAIRKAARSRSPMPCGIPSASAISSSTAAMCGAGASAAQPERDRTRGSDRDPDARGMGPEQPRVPEDVHRSSSRTPLPSRCMVRRAAAPNRVAGERVAPAERLRRHRCLLLAARGGGPDPRPARPA